MKLLTGLFEVAKLSGGHGQPYMIMSTYLKFWPAEYHSQSAIDARLCRFARRSAMRAESSRSTSTRSTRRSTSSARTRRSGGPERQGETADHSLPYCTAVALMDGDVTLASFSPDRLADPKLFDLVAKVKVHRDAALSARYPVGIPNRLTVTLDDNRQFVCEVEFPRGHAKNPMTDEEVEHKFRSTVEPAYGKKRATKILKRLWKMESEPARGILKWFKRS